MKTEFLKELKFKNQEINKKFKNEENFEFNNKSNMKDFIHESYEIYSITENEMKNIISRLKEKKNSIVFNISDYLKYICFSNFNNINKRNNLHLYRHLENVLDDIYEKFDIFNYIKKLKILELLNDLLLEQEQAFFINLISFRPYKIDPSCNSSKINEEFSQNSVLITNDEISSFDKILKFKGDRKNKKILDILLL